MGDYNDSSVNRLTTAGYIGMQTGTAGGTQRFDDFGGGNIGADTSQFITIGSTNSVSSLTLQAGTGNLLLTTNNANAKIIAQSQVNSTTAFQIQNSSASTLLNADTKNGQISVTGTTSSYSDEFNGASVDPKWTFTTNVTAPPATATEAAGKFTFTNGTGTDLHDCYVTPTTCMRLLETPPTGDFTAETKLDTMPGNVSQGLGILVWKDSNNFIRFELDGTGKVVAHMVIAGSGSTDIIACQSAYTAPTYIRVTRTGNVWTLMSSLDGSAYLYCGNFTQALDLSVGGAGIGLMFLNGSGSFTSANFDFFHLEVPALAVTGGATLKATSRGLLLDAQDANGNTILNLADHGDVWQLGLEGNLYVHGKALVKSGNNSSTAFQIQNAAGNDNLFLANTINSNLVNNSSAETDATGWENNTGSGSLPASDTSQALYGNASLAINTSATLNAGADYDSATLLNNSTTYSLSFWAKIASGSFTVEAGRADNDTFAGETTCTLNAATVTTTWTRFTCSFTTGTITTGGYIFIRQSDSTSRTWYVDGVQLESGISTPTVYHEGSLQFNGTITSPTTFKNASDTTAAFQIQNAAGSSILSVDTINSQVLVTNAGGNTSSDEFNTGSSPGSQWTLTTDDSSTATIGSGNLTLTPLAATNTHDCWTSGTGSYTNCLRLMESSPTTTGDFQIDTEIMNSNSIVGDEQGILVWQDADNFIRFANNGTASFTVHKVISNVGTANIFSCTPPAAPVYMRVVRQGSIWTMYYSSNGINYFTCGSLTQSLTVNNIGVNLVKNSTSWTTNLPAFNFFRVTLPALAVTGNAQFTSGVDGNLLQANDTSGGSILSLKQYDNNWNFNLTAVATFKNSTDSANAFQIQTAGGTNVLSASTTSGNVLINSSNANFAGSWSGGASGSLSANAESQYVTYNGYIYRVGGTLNGSTSTNTVQYAKLNADGSIGSWTTQANTINGGTGLEDSVAVAANGYIYVVGGWTTTQTNNTYYAKINSDGTTGPFATTTTLAANLSATAAVAYKGYIYEMGGYTGSPSTNVQYAKINADGTLGTWTATGAGTFTATEFGRAIAANGFIYYTGGIDGTNNAVTRVQRVPVNTDGTLGTWATTNSLAQATFGHGIGVVNGYMYVYGGGSGSLATPSAIAKVQYAKLNADGSTSTWTDDTAHPLPANEAYNGFANYNGYLYSLGGYTTGTTTTANIYTVSTNRLQLAGSLDLVGLTAGATAADSGNSGALTAGNTTIVGALNVQDQVNFGGTLSVRGDLDTQGKVAFQNQVDSTTAFQVQNAAGLSLLAVDTSGRIITISGDTTTFANLTLTNAHFKSTQTTAPTIGTPTNCATSPTAAVGTGSTDSAGSFRITSGTGGGQTTCDTVITFNKGYAAGPKSIVVVAETKDGGTGTAAARQIYVSNSSTTTFTVKMNNAPAGASEVNWYYYWVIE